MGGTPRACSSTCEQRDKCPTFIRLKCVSPVAWDKQCRQHIPANPSQRVHPEVPTGTYTALSSELTVNAFALPQALTCSTPPAASPPVLSTSRGGSILPQNTGKGECHQLVNLDPNPAELFLVGRHLHVFVPPNESLFGKAEGVPPAETSSMFCYVVQCRQTVSCLPTSHPSDIANRVADAAMRSVCLRRRRPSKLLQCGS